MMGPIRAFLIVVTVCGCNQAFDLTSTALRPDAYVVDDDGDGVDDTFDNCVGVANPLQSDVDRDTLGDACDNCPLIANAGQEHIGDADPLGDICDPHPATAGDCPVLVDAFMDPGQFLARWKVKEVVAGSVTAEAGRVELAASAGAMFTSTELAGDVFDVALLGRVTLAKGSGASFMAVSNATTLLSGYGCGDADVVMQEQAQAFWGNATNTGTGGNVLSSVPVASALSLRLVTKDTTGSVSLACRIDHGIAFGFGTISTPPAIATGSPGAAAYVVPATVYAIAVTRFEPGMMMCPPAVIR
ncbi:MAG TPA: thrombospondin type 3 repeat-containing protein [Kofleriaceae bacterium]|nr:thrombospondin type 3 repeat-containing protein [Kofleriaceae bacterium]